MHECLNKYQDIITIISFVTGIVSIILGICAILQSKKYNKESDYVNSDTKKILINQNEMLDLLFQKLNNQNTSKLNLKKDEIKLTKLHSYDKSNFEKIILELTLLSIKDSTLENIKAFLKNDLCKTHKVNFYSIAKTKDGDNVIKFYDIMLKYDILINFFRIYQV